MIGNLFQIHVPVLELMLRGTLVYWLLFCIFRFVLRRDVGAVGIADILLLVVIADAAQNAMSGGYQTVTEGAILVLTIVGVELAARPAVLPLRRGAALRAAPPPDVDPRRRAAAAQHAPRVHHASRNSRKSCANRASRR